MKTRALSIALAAGLAPAAAHADPAPPPSLHVETYTLPSGMQVVLAPDPTVTSVIVDIWFRVGSKDEVAGRTGFAHLFEHLMFEGSKHAPTGTFDRLLEAAGGWNNASTSEDRTEYTEQVPANQLALALWLEGDRIATLGDAIDQRALDNQRDVVENERRQSYENVPYGAPELLLPAALWPADSGNAHPVIGSIADLTAASLDDVLAFWHAHYAPSNATLVLAGGFDPKTARALIDTYLGWMKPSPDAPPAAKAIAHPVPLAKPVALAAKDDVSVPEVVMAWRADLPYTDTSSDLEIAAYLLGGGKTSRLYRRLVMKDRLASEVFVGYEPHVQGGEISVHAIARDGVSAAKLKAALVDELARFRKAPATDDELARARTALWAEELASLENLATRAGAINEWNALAGEPDFLAKERALLDAVTAARLAATAKTWLADSAAVTLIVTPSRRGLHGTEGAPPPPQGAVH
jgi:predicted Zn-dependent peptidase